MKAALHAITFALLMPLILLFIAGMWAWAATDYAINMARNRLARKMLKSKGG